MDKIDTMSSRYFSTQRLNWWLLLLILAITFLPFLGETLFNTKGEPREAIVAVSMLQSGDWVLPVSYGGDIPYKPPFLAWCIAAFSLLFGGEVTEFSSRLPSAVACIAMVMTVYTLYRRELGSRGGAVAMAAAVITFTAFEVHRAAVACRVDMVLTAFIVCAICTLFRYYRYRRWPMLLLSVLLMSGGVLTKGPVGMLLPCLVIGVYRLSEGERFWRVFFSLFIIGVSSMILPALWYVAAFGRGGDEFYRLAMEENFGRFLGKMSYSSHANPVWYNFVTLIAGFLPYTLLLLLSLFSLRYKRLKPAGWLNLRGVWAAFRRWAPATRLSFLAATLIFLFYCVPESKRSVYLLPVYPFISYFIAVYVRRMVAKGPRMVKAYCGFIGVLAVLAPFLFALIRFGALAGMGSGSLRRSIEGLASVDVGVTGLLMLALSFGGGLVLLFSLRRDSARRCFAWACGTTIFIYWSFSAVYQPGVLNPKSDFPVARELEAAYPADTHLYSLVNDPMLRYYTINFYLSDRMRRFDAELPEAGHLIVGRNDTELLLSPYTDSYAFTLDRAFDHRGCDVRQPIDVYSFVKK